MNTATSNDMSIITKLVSLTDADSAVNAFADFYRKHIPPTVVNNLSEDLKWVLNKARETATVLWLKGQRK